MTEKSLYVHVFTCMCFYLHRIASCDYSGLGTTSRDVYPKLEFFRNTSKHRQQPALSEPGHPRVSAHTLFFHRLPTPEPYFAHLRVQKASESPTAPLLLLGKSPMPNYLCVSILSHTHWQSQQIWRVGISWWLSSVAAALECLPQQPLTWKKLPTAFGGCYASVLIQMV
jgi:hypothetical protein